MSRDVQFNVNKNNTDTVYYPDPRAGTNPVYYPDPREGTNPVYYPDPRAGTNPVYYPDPRAGTYPVSYPDTTASTYPVSYPDTKPGTKPGRGMLFTTGNPSLSAIPDDPAMNPPITTVLQTTMTTVRQRLQNPYGQRQGLRTGIKSKPSGNRLESWSRNHLRGIPSPTISCSCPNGYYMTSYNADYNSIYCAQNGTNIPLGMPVPCGFI